MILTVEYDENRWYGASTSIQNTPSRRLLDAQSLFIQSEQILLIIFSN